MSRGLYRKSLEVRVLSFRDERFEELIKFGFAVREDLLVRVEKNEVVKLSGDPMEDVVEVEGYRRLLGLHSGRALGLLKCESVIAGFVALKGHNEDVGATLFPIDSGSQNIEREAVLDRTRQISSADLRLVVCESVVVFEKRFDEVVEALALGGPLRHEKNRCDWRSLLDGRTGRYCTDSV